MTWKEIEADEVKAGDYIDINGIYTPIVEANQFRVSYEAAGAVSTIDVQVANVLGMRFAREITDNPHGLIPTESGAVIRIGKCVYESYKGGWRQIGVEVFFSHETVQWCADRRGFDVLWPKQPAEITEEMVERAANALTTPNGWGYDYSEMPAEYQKILKADAKAVLEAALGGEQ